jgi:hypothetical protein
MPAFHMRCLKPLIIHIMCNELVAKVVEQNGEVQSSLLFTNTSTYITSCEWEGTTYMLDEFMECIHFLKFSFQKLSRSIFPSSIQNVPFT